MRRIRYLAMIVMLLCCIATFGQVGSGFNPASPSEPNAPKIPQTSQLTLLADPVGGGNPSSSGKFEVGSKINLAANKAGGFRFINWTNANDEVVSTNENFQFTKGEADETLTAHYVYEPASPNEPTDPYLQIKVQLNVVAGEGGSASGGGKYLAGSNVTLNASPAGNYVFKNWTDESDNVVSTNASFSYTVKSHVETIRANFTYVPGSPNEPDAPNPSLTATKYNVFTVATEGGSVSASQKAATGTNVTVSANVNGGYDWVGWFKDGLLYNSNLSFTYTVGEEDVTFEARFRYNPASPNEPTAPKKYIYYIEEVNGFQGEELQLSVFLSSQGNIGDFTFQLGFPERLVPTDEAISYADRLDGYSKTLTRIDGVNLKFEFTGGELQAGNGALVTFRIPVPEDYPTGTRNPVRMNQISFTEVGGSSQTTQARNANIGVFKRGDVNGDNTIDVADIHAMMLYLRSMIDATDGFIVEAADADKNGSANADDLATIRTWARQNLADTPATASDNTLYVTSFETINGVTSANNKTFSVGLTNAVDIWGVQFDVRLPEGMELTAPRTERNADRLGFYVADFNLETSATEDGWIRVFATPANVERFIVGFEGEIMKMHYATDPTMALGSHHIELRNVKLALQGLNVDYPLCTYATVDVHTHDNVEGTCPVCGELLTYTRATTPERYGTICLPKGAALSDVSGAAFYSIAGKRVDSEGDATSIVLEEVDDLVAGQPYIFLATESTLHVTYSGQAVNAAGSDNGLVGSFAGQDVEEGMYLLSNNQIVKCGTGCTIGVNRAYINMNEVEEYVGTPSASARMISIGKDTPTGIDGINIEGDAVRYNLSGIRIPYGTKGIIIVNGKKMSNR